MIFKSIILVTTGTMTALIAGLFFGFAVSVNGGLHRLKDSEYVAAMQSINIAIQNPLFLLTFFGPVILLPWVTFLYREVDFALLFASSVLYIAGSFGLTIVGNVPLNEKLARFEISKAADKEIADAREQFESPWNRLHAIRTIASVAATVLIFAACALD